MHRFAGSMVDQAHYRCSNERSSLVVEGRRLAAVFARSGDNACGMYARFGRPGVCRALVARQTVHPFAQPPAGRGVCPAATSAVAVSAQATLRRVD